MNKEIMQWTFRILFSKALLFLLIVSINAESFSQNTTRNADSTYYYKNAIKGFVLIAPLHPVLYFAGLSIAYEGNISKHNTLELGVNYGFYIDEMGTKRHIIGIMPAYKYYIISKRKGLNDVWISGYLSYIYNTHIHTESEDNTRHSLYYYGIGVSIGKRLFLSKNKNIFIDFGIGGSINIYDDKPMFSDNVWNAMFLPRPIIQIGGKF